MPPTDSIDDVASTPDTAAPTSPGALTLVREVQGPGSDRSRVAGLAMVCSAAGVALGFALAGSLFAAMAPQSRPAMGPAGWSHCPGHDGWHAGGMRGDGYHVDSQPRPWLGITVDVGVDGRRPSPPVLTGVFSGAPAAAAGLRPGDRVTRFDGEPVETAGELLGLIRAHQPGDLVNLEVDGRDGRQVAIQGLRLATMPLPAR